MGFDWKETLRTVAPSLAHILGGPLAGSAVGALSNALLGKPDGTEDEIAAIVSTGSPETLLKLREADNEFKLAMKQAKIDIEKVHADDRADAREMQKETKDWAPAILALFSFSGFFGILAGLIIWGDRIPDKAFPPLMVMLGALGAIVTQIANYYYGSSKGSSEKNQTITSLINGKK